MKKTTLLIIGLLMAAGVAKAQNYDSIAHHKAGWYDIDMRDDILQLRDGSILAHIQLFEVDEQGYYVGDYGNRFYKISRNGAVIMDSVFIEDNDLNWFLLKRNPLGDDNVFAKLVRDLENQRTDLRVRFFDDELNFYPEKDILVPISDTLFPPLCDSYLMLDDGDIILCYPLPEGNVFVQVGLDGTLKRQSLIPYSAFYPMGYPSGQRLFVFNESPLEYCLCAYDDETELQILVLDTLLNMKEVLKPDGTPSGTLFSYGAKDRFLNWDANNFMVENQYRILQSPFEDGVVVIRYDKQTLEALNIRRFPTQPQSQFGCAFGFGLAKSGDGNMYFSYCTQDPTSGDFGNPVGQVSVVKMDADFNIIWQRFCLEPQGYSRIGSEMVALEDGGVAVAGIIRGTPPEIFFLSFNDEGWETAEYKCFVRPYAYYPNPTRDELRLQYSPDVKPTQIELYDIQGRLVKTQRTGMESLNLQGLASGTYTMRVTLEGGNVFSDKVIKE